MRRPLHKKLALAGLVALVLVAGACNGDPGQKESVFESGPRFPDDEGVATDVTFERLILDGRRRYEIKQTVQSFSTYDGTITPLVFWKNRYVHVGLDDEKKAEWIAGIGLIIEGDVPHVVYNGVVDKVDAKKRELIFRDGTVLKMTAIVTAPEPGTRIKATISPVKRGIIEIVQQ